MSPSPLRQAFRETWFPYWLMASGGESKPSLACAWAGSVSAPGAPIGRVARSLRPRWQVAEDPYKKSSVGWSSRKIMATTLPIINDFGMGPNNRESHECVRLSPITK